MTYQYIRSNSPSSCTVQNDRPRFISCVKQEKGPFNSVPVLLYYHCCPSCSPFGYPNSIHSDCGLGSELNQEVNQLLSPSGLYSWKTVPLVLSFSSTNPFLLILDHCLPRPPASESCAALQVEWIFNNSPRVICIRSTPKFAYICIHFQHTLTLWDGDSHKGQGGGGGPLVVLTWSREIAHQRF